MGSNDLLGKHCSLLSCSLTCRSGRSRPAETGRHLNGLWHEGGLSSYRDALVALTATTQPEGPDTMAADEEAGRRLAPQAANPPPLAQHAVRRQTPEVGAVCGNAARTVLCGGRSVMSVPTAIT